MARPPSTDPVVQRKIGLAASAWAEVDEAAKKAGLSPHQWIKDAVREKLTAPSGAISTNTPQGPVLPSPGFRPVRSVADLYSEPKDCPHPVGRRTRDGYCLSCGTKVKKP